MAPQISKHSKCLFFFVQQIQLFQIAFCVICAHAGRRIAAQWPRASENNHILRTLVSFMGFRFHLWSNIKADFLNLHCAQYASDVTQLITSARTVTPSIFSLTYNSFRKTRFTTWTCPDDCTKTPLHPPRISLRCRKVQNESKLKANLLKLTVKRV